MALCFSQVFIFNPSTVPKSSDSRSFFTSRNRLVNICRQSSVPFNHWSVQVSSVGSDRITATSEKYVYSDPDPAFAEAEVVKFRVEILKKLGNEKEEFGDSLNEVVDVCEQVLGEFLLSGYGGPGTFIVEPFTYILVLLKEKKLPGASLAARTSLLWAQKHLDKDWKAWMSIQHK